MANLLDYGSTWSKTAKYLREARANLSESAEGVCADEIVEFEEYLSHNEFELALDALEVAFDKGDAANWRVLEYMGMAAFSMQLFDRQRRYDDRLTQARGWPYKTPVPR
ncbi:hypothetical protein EOS_20800 [Caballeronia mineralivorans PML1(12)]|uniref:Uncharacterized protein n=1 Tax=Caballeronia mineralivorans PML1(12) TaxID=908627 RepID=A0A0J1CVE7_9BURK|nr:hypothetical protein [Caballeronia mineralivorans]KLU24301.1 hypothetical protein EOS_20800 [Caballeronia mineralivorans PML1(12)]